jgi:hypothetical protein
MGKTTEPTYRIVKKNGQRGFIGRAKTARIEARHGVYDLGTPLTKPGVW